MSMSSSRSTLASDINVTPMIDVLLVLLIIFMTITPVAPHGLNARLLQPAQDNQKAEEVQAIVLEVVSGKGSGAPEYRINDQQMSLSQLQIKLMEIFVARSDRTLFLKGDADLDFASIAQVIDMAHAAKCRKCRHPHPEGRQQTLGQLMSS